MCGNMIDPSDVVKTETIVELKEILADDFNVLVTSYLEDAQARIKKLQLAIEDADAAVIKAEAHSLKGSSLNLGARSLPELCSQLESCGDTDSLEDTPALFSQIENEFLRVETVLSQHAS
ncbi:MAG: HPt (histidine-containing phosphotransfer) domain-containing protein [Pseudohongiellaceae bacterium]|jgi:HPt (histidine-containing phosphotransfer) domain-containing protein